MNRYIFELRTSFRQVFQSRKFLLTYSLAIGLYVSAVLILVSQLYSIFYKNEVDINGAEIYSLTSKSDFLGLDLHYYKYIKENQNVFAKISAFSYSRHILSFQGGFEDVDVCETDAEFFHIFGSPVIMGRSIEERDMKEDAAKVIVISRSFSNEKFGGSASALGKLVKLNETYYTIVGILDDSFHYPRNHDLWIPRPSSLTPKAGENIGFTLLGVAKTSYGEADIVRDMKSLQTKYFDRYAKNLAPKIFQVLEFNKLHQKNHAFILGVMCFTLLAILSGGIISLSTFMVFQNFKKTKNIKIKRLLGYTTTELLVSPVTQIFAIFTIGYCIGYLCFLVIHSNFSEFAIVNIPGSPFWWSLDIPISENICIYLCLLSAVIFFSLTPLLKVLNPNTFVSSESRITRNLSNTFFLVLRTLFSIQFISTLLITYFVMWMCLIYFEKVHSSHGVNSEDVFTGKIKTNVAGNVSNETLNNLRFLSEIFPGQIINRFPNDIREVAYSDLVPNSSATNYSFYRLPDKKNEFSSGMSNKITVSNSFFKLFGISIVDGRSFDRGDILGAKKVAIVDSKTASKLWPQSSPIGKLIQLDSGKNGDLYTVVGVCSDIDWSTEPTVIYTSVNQSYTPLNSIFVHVAKREHGSDRFLNILFSDPDMKNYFFGFEPISDIQKKSGRETLTMILNFLPAAVLSILMAGMSTLNASELYLLFQRKNIATYLTFGFDNKWIAWRYCKGYLITILVSSVLAIAIWLFLNDFFSKSLLAYEKDNNLFIIILASIVTFVTAISCLYFPLMKQLRRPISHLLREKLI